MSKKWRYSDELFLRINYGRMTYLEMQKKMNDFHSEKAISNKAVTMGISNKRNWEKGEIKLLKSDPEKINRSWNACKIKRSRLCIR